jgi:hypothetical protein
MKSKLLLVGAALYNQLVVAVNFYISLNGSDSNTGTSSAAAFQTFSKAQQAVRGQLGGALTENITVHIGPGTYTLSAPLKFTADDSEATWSKDGLQAPTACILLVRPSASSLAICM